MEFMQPFFCHKQQILMKRETKENSSAKTRNRQEAWPCLLSSAHSSTCQDTSAHSIPGLLRTLADELIQGLPSLLGWQEADLYHCIKVLSFLQRTKAINGFYIIVRQTTATALRKQFAFLQSKDKMLSAGKRTMNFMYQVK